MDTDRRRPGFWGLAALAFTGSLLLALGSPPDGWAPLIWLGFLPLTWVARLSAGLSLRRLFALGWFGGLCVGLVGFPWIAETLVRFAEFPWPLAAFGLFCFSAWTAIPFGIWMIGTRLGPRDGVLGTLWPAVLWVALAAMWPALFPYTVVIGLALTPAWMQAAELGGVASCELQVVVVGVLLADGALHARRARGRWLRWVLALAIPLLSYALGSWRIEQLRAELEDAPTVRFGLVQPNTPLLSRDVDDKIRRLREQSRFAEVEGAQIVVWPEAGAFPFVARRPFTRDFEHPSRKILAAHDVPTVLGIATYDSAERYEFNSVAALDEAGRTVGFFDKVELVPFGEYVPVVDPDWARELVPAMSHNLAGAGPARFVLEPKAVPGRREPAPIALGPLICYEDIFPAFARDVARQPGGIDAFVNVTIDTWFGDTAEPWEHLALAQFRSVEHRVPMVRSVAAGPTSYVDLTGALVQALPVTAPTLEHSVPAQRLVIDVPLARNTAERPTVYARFGWVFPWLCVVGVAAAALAGAARKKYSGRASDAHD